MSLRRVPALVLVASALLCCGHPLTAGQGVSLGDLESVYAAAADASSLQLLQSTWPRLYGSRLEPVTEGPVPKGATGIFLGKYAVECGMIDEQELARAIPGGYVMKCASGRVAIAGPNIHCTRHGVQAFLEKLGVRFYERRSHIPRSKITSLAPFEVIDKPAMVYRNFTSRAEWADCRKVTEPEVLKEADLWIDHSAGYLVPKKLYYDEHPDYFAMLKNGKRIPKDQFTYHRTPLCLSNPGVIKLSCERALAWVQKQPHKTFFPITYGDTGAWCQCPECLKLDPAPGQYATRLLHWVNAVAKAIGEEYPDKIIITFAYGGSDAVPPVARPAKNVWMCVASGMASLPFWHHAEAVKYRAMVNGMAKIDGWLKVAPQQVTVCEYLSGKYLPSMPDFLAARLGHHVRRGVRGMMFTFGHPKNFTPLWEYLYPKLMWNPKQDAHALTREFASFHYGPAAEVMTKYFELCHRRYFETQKDLQKLDGRYPPGFYSTDFANRALAQFAAAEKATGGGTGLARGIAKEERMFIMDWMKHPLCKKLTPAAKAVLMSQLDRLSELAGDSEKDKIAFAREIHRVGLAIDAIQKGALAIVEEWIHAQGFPTPKAEKIPGGIRLRSDIWMFDGWGPRVYDGHAHAVPPRMVVVVYVKGNSQNRSHHMEAHFELDEVPGDGSAALDIEGADCDHEVDTAAIRIEINGTSIFEGQVLTVKWHWSRQQLKIPPGLLKKGDNKVEIINAADPKSIKNWYERWFMLSDAVIRFKAK